VSVAVVVLTGFAILCDWLGSSGQYFPPQPDAGLPEYVLVSRRPAADAVAFSGVCQASAGTVPEQFALLFPQCAPARPLQTAIDRIPDALLAQPCRAVIEAPTGEDKTEAAPALRA
jgi:CRISPR-associated endonuclease/helicase Cas3